jgi:hypothetical protein
MEEGMMLRRQIRDEKEEVDRREGMNEEGEDEADAEREGTTPRPVPSGNLTPQPDGETQIKSGNDAENEDEAMGAGVSSRDRTPLGGTPAPDKAGSKAAPTPAESTSSAPQASGQYLQVPGGATPSRQSDQGAGDVDMEDQATQATGQDTEEGDDGMEVDE